MALSVNARDVPTSPIPCFFTLIMLIKFDLHCLSKAASVCAEQLFSILQHLHLG